MPAAETSEESQSAPPAKEEKTSSIPSIPRTRPPSIDSNPSFAATSAPVKQQEISPRNSENSSAADGTRTSTGAASPRPGRDKDPQFDFQKFLDQMKMKQAEPVAKYLRS